MTSAALLQLHGNPFLLRYWLRNYCQVWRGEVDELHVFVNGLRDQEAAEECRRMCTAAGAASFRHQPERLVHGDAAARLFQQTDADVVMLVEDDAFVRHPRAVSHAVSLAGAGYVVGSPRGGMSPEVEQAAREKWGQDPEGPDGSVGYGLWPCFLFGRRELLAPVMHLFQSRSWRAGEEVSGLGRAFPHEVTTDTFTAAAFVLRDRGTPMIYEGQWKELWLRDLAAARDRAGYDPPWFHAGGLSNEDFHSGGGALGLRPGIGGSNEGNDWAHRVWWIRRALTTGGPGMLPGMQAAYWEGLRRLVETAGILDECEAWERGEEPWIT